MPDYKQKLAKTKEQRKLDPARYILYDSRKFDKAAGFANNLTYTFIKDAIGHPCTYCGETGLRMTLDRIDNRAGHVQLNVVPACIRCNYLRGSVPYAAWLCMVPGVREAVQRGLFEGWTGRCT